MKYPKIQLAQTIIQLSRLYDIKHIVISPGSRNAPLTLGFYEDDFFKCYSIVDERSAGFFALGLAQQLRQTVGLVCTSGSALLNYYPAISEAFYSDIPLAVISADRPLSKIDIGDGQTIRQFGVFSNHILYSAQLNEAETAFSENELKINEAFSIALNQSGPVHLNAPFEEPLYEMTDTLSVFPKKTAVTPEEFSSEKEVALFLEKWNRSEKKMILTGVNFPGDLPDGFIEKLAGDPSVLVFTETTSNLHHEKFFPGIDKIIAPVENYEHIISELQPEVLLTFGGMIISKKIKAFLRKFKPVYHFHIDKKKAYDTFFSLTAHIKMRPDAFFAKHGHQMEIRQHGYRDHWLEVQKMRKKAHLSYIKKIPFSDFLAYHHVFNTIPENYVLQLSNSSTVRYTQLFDLNAGLKVFCNRGTSGIDGSTSTAIGGAFITKTPTLLITGDLSFFYDSNALWNDYIPENFRIIVLNNSGGGIFRILPGPKNTPKFNKYFETTHQLTAKALCEMFSFEYQAAKDENSLEKALKDFYEDSEMPKLLEIFTPRTTNDQILLDYFSYLYNTSS